MRNSLSLQTAQNSSRRLFSYAFIGLSVAATFLWSGDAHAVTSGTMGAIVCNVVNQIYSPSTPTARIAVLMTGIAYIAGGIAIGNGLFKLKEYADSPGRPPLHQPLARLIGGAALLALPAMFSWIIATMTLTGGAGGLTACNPGNVTAATGTDPSVWFKNLVNNIKDPDDHLNISAWLHAWYVADATWSSQAVKIWR